MISTTALGDSDLADISSRHLTSDAAAIRTINHAIATVVVRELTKDSHDVQNGADDRTPKIVNQAWTPASN